ncbi:MAG: glycosyltransferase [Pseudonocardiales bacterium]|nr:MAG: glycosyltransferase [Pseudonocardiales bacterium]
MSTVQTAVAVFDGRADQPRPAASSWGRWQRLGADVPIILTLAVVALLANAWNITGFPAVGDDEGTYLAQAWAIQHGEGLAHYTYWYDHPPFGWIQIAALSWLPAALLPEHLAVANGRAIMPVVTAVAVLLLYVLARRVGLNRWWSVLAGLLFTLSPLSLALQRQVYLDNFAVVWMLAAFVLALSPRRHLWHHIAAGTCAGLAVLSKETMLIVLPALVVALWQASDPTTRKFSFAGFFSALGLVGGIFPLFALLKGELLPGAGHVSLVGGTLFQLQRPGSGSFLVSGSGSQAVLGTWLNYDSFLIVAGVLGAAVSLALPRMRAPALAVVLLVVVAARPGYLPIMYVIQALPFLALCIAGTLAAGTTTVLRWRSSRPSLVRWTALALVAAAAAGLMGYVGPRWYAGDREAFTASYNGSYLAAVTWIRDDLPHTAKSRILVDDALWLDLVKDGSQPGAGAIWFYKLDRVDPGINLPRGWRDLNYIVSTPIMRQALSGGLPNVRAALEHSALLQTFGTGESRVEIRAVTPTS